MTSDDTVQVCPGCDSGRIQRRSGRGESTDDHDWRCDDCGHTFDEPVERAPQGHRNGRQGLAGELSDTDPDDVGGAA